MAGSERNLVVANSSWVSIEILGSSSESVVDYWLASLQLVELLSRLKVHSEVASQLVPEAEVVDIRLG